MIAARLLVRRLPLYAAACAATIALETALFYAMHATERADLIAVFIAIPLLDAVVVVSIGADASGVLHTAKARFERIVERAWSLIVISIIVNLIGFIAFAGLHSSDPTDAIMSVLILFLAAMLTYAEPYACLEEHASPLTVVPFAFLRSMMLAWVNVPRIATFFAVTLAVTLAEQGLIAVLQQIHAPGISFWNFAYSAIVDAIVMAYFTAAYLDTIEQERETSPR